MKITTPSTSIHSCSCHCDAGNTFCCLFTPEKNPRNQIYHVSDMDLTSRPFSTPFCSERSLFISLRNIKVSSSLGHPLNTFSFSWFIKQTKRKRFSFHCSFHLTPLSMVQWKFHPFSFSLIFWQRCETFLWQQNMNTEKARRKSLAMFLEAELE